MQHKFVQHVCSPRMCSSVCCWLKSVHQPTNSSENSPNPRAALSIPPAVRPRRLKRLHSRPPPTFTIFAPPLGCLNPLKRYSLQSFTRLRCPEAWCLNPASSNAVSAVINTVHWNQFKNINNSKKNLL